MAKEDIILKVSLEGAQEELTVLEKLNKEIKRLADQKKRLNQEEKDLAAEVKKGTKTQEEANEQLKKINAQQVENNTALKLNKAAYRENERAVINNSKARQTQLGSLERMKAELSKDTFAYNKLSDAQKQNAAIGGVLQKRILSNTNALKKQEAALGNNRREVGNYGNAFKKVTGALGRFAGALGITAGIAGLTRVLSGAVKIAKDFEQGNANLAAVLGKASSEITELTEDAKRLGASTSFTASQVSELQTEFAKLGFNEKEILNATEATLDLAAATGSDLGEAAAIAGATLGGFGLDATETQRVTDVMAKSFSTSALDIEKFRESMKSAAPAARAIGVDVEETTALLGTLANAGVSGSMAGTALRKSFIELNAAGLTLDEGLAQVANSEDKLGAATDLVGKKAASSFLILAEGQDVTKELVIGLDNAGGAAKKMADEQLNTLEGQTKILNSAWEGLVLSLLSGDSAFNSIAKSIVESATGALTFLTNTEKLSEALEEERVALGATKLELLSANTSAERRTEIIEELKKEYPKYLENINAETASNEELVTALANVNKGLINKIVLQEKQEEVTEQNNKTAQQTIDLLKAQDTLQKQFGESLNSFNEGKAEADKFNIDSQKTEIENAKALLKLIDEEGGLLSALSGERSALAASISGVRANTNLLNQEEEKGNALLTEKEDLMARLGIQTDITTEASYGGLAATEDATEATEEQTEATSGLIEEQKELKKIAQDLPEDTEAQIATKNKLIKTYDDEIARLKKLGIEEVEKAKTQKQLDADELKSKNKVVDEKIKLLQVEHKLELAQKDLNDEEKLAKEAAYLDKLGKLRIEKAVLNDENLTLVKKENELARAEALKETTDGIKEQELEDEKEKEQFKRRLRSETEDLAVEGGKALVAVAEQRAEREKEIELANLNAKLEGGLISQEEFESKRLAIEQKAFKDKKKRDLAIVAIDLAKELSSISAAAAANPANAITFGGAGISQAAVLSAIAVGRSAVQAGIIASQKFAQGGVIHGNSHANGGVKVNVGGSGMIEAEGGEAIINKKSTAKHLGLLSAINVDGGGVPLAEKGMVMPNTSTLARFGNGGVATAPSVQNQTIDLDGLEARIASAVGSIKVQNVASETTGVSNRVEQIQDSASF